MKLNKKLKWVIAAALSVTTVAATVSIANAYTIHPDSTSNSTVNIINNSNCHFKLEANDAIKQARSFKINVDIVAYSSTYYGDFPAKVTLEYGSYDSEGNEVKLGELVKEGAGSVDLTGTLSADGVASGKFWLRAPGNGWDSRFYSKVTFHSISFLDENGNCILYGSADSGPYNRKWTFYQLESPEIGVSGNANPDGSYFNSAEVSARQADSPTKVLTYDGSNANACTWGDNISTVLVRGGETLNTDNITFAEGGVNEYGYTAYTKATISDTMNLDGEGNPLKVELYSPVVETTVKLTDKYGLATPDKPVVVDESALTSSAFEGRTADDILFAANAKAGANTVTDGIKLGINGLPDCRIAKINDIVDDEVFRTYYVPVTYTEVQGFDPAVRAEQTVTLMGKADVSKLDVPTGYDNTVTVTGVKIASDYLTGVTLTPPTKTAYKIGETLDLTGGKLTLSYEKSQDAEIPLTDSKVKVTGDIGSIGDKTITVEYLAAQGEAKQGAELTKTFSVSVSLVGTVSNPVFSHTTGEYNAPFDVTITADGADIYYTTDGTDPSAQSTLYTAPVTIDKTTILKAIAIKANWADSGVAEATYTMVLTAPEISPNGGKFSGSQTVTITAQGGADIYYTTDGEEPTAQSTKYSEPFTITDTTTVKALAIKANWTNSEISTAVFTLNTIPTPPIGGGGGGSSRPAIDFSFTIYGGTEISHTLVNDKSVNDKVKFEFDKDSANKFATIFKFDYTKLTKVFVDVARIDPDSKATLSLTGKGSYYVFIADTTYLNGDMNNDGVLDKLDTVAILKHIVELAAGANPEMADFNGDGKINAFDAAEILKRFVNNG